MISFLSILIYSVFSIPNASANVVDTCKDCNVILISLTSTRPRNMSLYGYKRETTPNINRFFKNSYIFKNAFAPGSLTFTDSISLFFSLSPNIHRAFKRARYEQAAHLLQGYTSLATIFGNNGYTTSAFVADEDYQYGWGIGRTFQSFFDRSSYADNGISFKPMTFSVGTEQLVPLVNRWLDNNKKKKFFLFLQAYDMHCPYGPNGEFSKLYQSPHSSKIPFETECFMNKEEFKEFKIKNKPYVKLQSFFAFRNQSELTYLFDKQDIEFLKSRYDAELTKADHNLGSLFNQIEKLKLDKNTVIIFMADHGDNLGENNFFMKSSPTQKGNLHNANLNYPLIFKIPQRKSKDKFKEQLIQTIDIAPTILDTVGLKSDPKMQGKSFKACFDNSKEINDYVYGYSIRYDVEKVGTFSKTFFEHETLQNHEWKLNFSSQFSNETNKLIKTEYALYHLSKDPLEKINLANSLKSKKEELEKIIQLKRNLYSSVKK